MTLENTARGSFLTKITFDIYLHSRFLTGICLVKKNADCLNCAAPVGSRGIRLVSLGLYRSADDNAISRLQISSSVD